MLAKQLTASERYLANWLNANVILPNQTTEQNSEKSRVTRVQRKQNETNPPRLRLTEMSTDIPANDSNRARVIFGSSSRPRCCLPHYLDAPFATNEEDTQSSSSFTIMVVSCPLAVKTVDCPQVTWIFFIYTRKLFVRGIKCECIKTNNFTLTPLCRICAYSG